NRPPHSTKVAPVEVSLVDLVGYGWRRSAIETVQYLKGGGFMRPSIRIGRILGIQIGLHYSLFIIASLICFSLAGHFRSVNPQWSASMVWILAGTTGVLFFASIVAHEMAHAVVANSRGMPVRSITLFALGGVANVEQESSDARSEFWMAIAGP